MAVIHEINPVVCSNNDVPIPDNIELWVVTSFFVGCTGKNDVPTQAWIQLWVVAL